MRLAEFKQLLRALDEELSSDRPSARQARAILAALDDADEAMCAALVRDLLHVLWADDYGLTLDGLVVVGERDSWIPLHNIAFGEGSVDRGWITDIAAPSSTGAISVKIQWQPAGDGGAEDVAEPIEASGPAWRTGHTSQLALQHLDVLRHSGSAFRWIDGLSTPVQPATGAPAASGADETIHRTPHIDAGEYNDALVPINTTFPVRVYLDTEALQPGEEGASAELPNQQLRLTVNLTVSSHFTINGLSSGQIDVDPAEAQSSEATFSITCQRADKGHAGIAAVLFHEWRPVGNISRRLTIEGSEPTAVQPLITAPNPGGGVGIHTGAIAPADLTITVREAPGGDGRRYAITVCSPHLKRLQQGVTVRWDLPSATHKMVQDKMADFLTRDPGGRVAALRGAGIAMFSATPQGFRDMFWELLDHAHANNIDLETIYVVTDEPHIPWELMMPHRAGEDPRPALGVEFAVGRWVHQGLLSPKQTEPITDSWIIAPDYLAPDTLTFAPAEADFICENFHGTRLTPAHIQNIDRQLIVRGASLLHFICHGVSEETRQILKLDPDEQLTDNQLLGLRGVTRALRDYKSFVFINACQVGQVMPALAGSTGFAAVFTAMGARGVVAPIWSVRDSIAAEVAREFYTRIKADPTVPYAEVLQDIRRRAYDGDDPEDSYAAYCFYGDPNSAQAPAATG